jgi:DNA repair protein RecO
MPREKTYTGIILKKQPLSEADELLTIYTQESGKIRAVAKSSKLPKSKLAFQLQPMFLCEFTLAGNGTLAKIIRIDTKAIFRNIYDSQDRVRLWYVAAELVMRATPDEQVSHDLYQALNSFLIALDDEDLSVNHTMLILIKFKLDVLNALGLGIQYPQAGVTDQIFFANTLGGFSSGEKPLGGLVITPAVYDLFVRLSKSYYSELKSINADAEQLNTLVSQYINYQLEREIRAEKFIFSA